MIVTVAFNALDLAKLWKSLYNVREKKLYILVFLCCYHLLLRKIKEKWKQLNVETLEAFSSFSSGRGGVKMVFCFPNFHSYVTYSQLEVIFWILFWSSDISLLPPFRWKMRHARADNFICVTSSTLGPGWSLEKPKKKMGLDCAFPFSWP